MTGIEIAVGYVFAWAVRKARRVAGRSDAEVDRALDAGMERLHELVSRKLGGDSALQHLQEEAEAGREEISPRTRTRLELALEEAAERDPDFAEAVLAAVREVQAASPPVSRAVVARDTGQAIGGDVTIRADHGSAAGLRMGDVTLHNPSQPGPDQH